MNALKGYKTYIGLGLTIIVMVAVNVFGISVTGFASDSDWMKSVAELVIAGFFRAGMK